MFEFGLTTSPIYKTHVASLQERLPERGRKSTRQLLRLQRRLHIHLALPHEVVVVVVVVEVVVLDVLLLVVVVGAASVDVVEPIY